MAEMDPELIELFKEESFERLGRAVALIGEIRAGRQVQAAIEEIDRELHTIKGSVKMLGFARLGSFVHEVEAVSRLLLEAWQRGQLDSALVELLEESCDEILRHIEIATESGADSHPVALMERVRRLFAGAPVEAGAEALENSGSASGESGLVVGASPESKPPRPSSDSGVFPSLKEAMLNKPQRPVLNSSEEVPAARTESGKKRALPNEELVRVRSSKLASLDALVSDLIDSRLRLDHHEQSLRGLLKAAEEVERAGLEDAKALYSQFREDRRHLDFIVKGLEQLAIDLRLRPLSRVFDQVARVARDLARRFGKSVNIEIHGENTELDRVILDGIQDPLHHIIRNVVDHGVELPAQRLAAGKPEAGHIELSANQEGGAVVIRISDDGAGVDTAKLKARVIEKGLLSADAVAEMSHQELIDLVFIPGLSTRTEATETSGRGVGMDVVRRNVEALKGEAHIDSTLGQGTIIELRVPLTLLVSRVLLVRAGGSLFAIPTEALDSTESLRPEEIAEYAGQTVMRLRGRDVPIVPLSKLMNLPDEDTDQRRRVAVVRHKEELLALDIEAFVGERSVVIKPLGWPLVRVPGIAGAVLLGSGEVALTLHVPELIERSFLELPRGQTGRLMAARTRKAKAPKRQTILITDDSPTYRNLAVSAVEAFGYRVIVAHDGQQAWEKMSEEKPDLLLTDLEMPRLNGLGLVERVRGDERTQGIPIIMFSTRASPEDRKRAQDAGVDVYIHKTDWNDRLLGDAIRKLLDE